MRGHKSRREQEDHEPGCRHGAPRRLADVGHLPAGLPLMEVLCIFTAGGDPQICWKDTGGIQDMYSLRSFISFSMMRVTRRSNLQLIDNWRVIRKRRLMRRNRSLSGPGGHSGGSRPQPNWAWSHQTPQRRHLRPRQPERKQRPALPPGPRAAAAPNGSRAVVQSPAMRTMTRVRTVNVGRTA